MKLTRSFVYALLFICFSVAMSIPPGVQAQTADSLSNTIDLQTDNNHDGLPDALVAAIKQIEASANSAEAASSDSTQRQTMLDSALFDLRDRLPYSEETLALQARVGTIQERLNVATDATESEALIAELQQIETQMAQDPNWVITVKTMETLFTPDAGVSNIAPENSQLTNRIFLPMISQVIVKDTAQALEPSFDSTIGTASVNAGPNFGALLRGHIMLINGGSSFASFVYVMNYSHSGTYDGSNSTGQWVYESNGDGVRLKPLSKWKARGLYVALANNNKLNSYDQVYVLNQGKTKYKTDGSTPYNYNFTDKTTDSKLYCSQLVWKMNMMRNIDLDSNAWSYQLYIWTKFGLLGNAFAIPAVAPDEVALDGDITIYSQGANP